MLIVSYDSAGLQRAVKWLDVCCKCTEVADHTAHTDLLEGKEPCLKVAQTNQRC